MLHVQNCRSQLEDVGHVTRARPGLELENLHYLGPESEIESVQESIAQTSSIYIIYNNYGVRLYLSVNLCSVIGYVDDCRIWNNLLVIAT